MNSHTPGPSLSVFIIVELLAWQSQGLQLGLPEKSKPPLQKIQVVRSLFDQNIIFHLLRLTDMMTDSTHASMDMETDPNWLTDYKMAQSSGKLRLANGPIYTRKAFPLPSL